MRCEWCGEQIEQKAFGRKRKTCKKSCRSKKSRELNAADEIKEPIRRVVRVRRCDFVDEALAHAASSGYSITLPVELGAALPHLGPKDTYLVGMAEAERAPEEVEWKRHSLLEQVRRGTSVGEVR